MHLILIISLLVSISVIAEPIPIEQLNPDLRKQIDAEFLNNIQNKTNDNTAADKEKTQSFFSKDANLDGVDINAAADQFKNSMQSNNEADYISSGTNARNAPHNEVVKSILEKPNIAEFDNDDPIFTRANEIMADPGKEIGDCMEEKDENTTPVWRKLTTKTKVINSIHKKNVCEHLQNTYAGYKTLNLKCVKRGKKYSNWIHGGEYFSMYMLTSKYGETNSIYKGWMLDYIIDDGCNHKTGEGDRNRNPYPVTYFFNENQYSKKLYVAQKHNISIDDVADDINLGYAEQGFKDAKLSYNYRNFEEICEQWIEQWEESCTHIAR